MAFRKLGLLALTGVAALSIACSGGGEKSETKESKGGEKAEAAQLVKGKPAGEFFSANCASCHGAKREGISGLGLPLTPDKLTKEDSFYQDTIKNGRAGTVMPAWGSQGLTDADITTMVKFLKTNKP